jgi:pimeloyl-ACP methyl ester carboxylesterase
MEQRRHESPSLPLPGGGTLKGTLSWRDNLGPAAVLYVHGFGSTRGGAKGEALEAACAGRGWTFAAFDFRGHGQSSGTLLEPRGSGLLEDLEAIRTYLTGRGVRCLFPVGSSMGGWATAWFCQRNPEIVPACTLLSPALHFLQRGWKRLTDAERHTWRQTGRLRVSNEWLDVEIGPGLMEEHELFDPNRLIAHWMTPTLLFHGMRDDVVPYADSLALVERTPFGALELRLFKDGDHRLLAHAEEMAESACRFFARWWLPSSESRENPCPGRSGLA